MSVLAPKKTTTTDVDGEEEDLVNDEETTKAIADSAIAMTDNIMKGWPESFSFDDLSSLL